MDRSINFFTKKGLTIKDAMRVIDSNGMGITFVTDENNIFQGTVSDGDIRKALTYGKSVELKIEEIMNSKPIIAKEGDSLNLIREIVSQNKSRFSTAYSLKIPILNQRGEVVNVAITSIGSEQIYFLNEISNIFNKKINKVLIIGGSGYIGSVLSKKLLQLGYKVRILDNHIFGKEPVSELLNNPCFELIDGDMRDIRMITSSLEEVDAVILLAGIVGDPASSKNPKETIETNYFATMTIAQACKYYQINRFIFASTCSVYGSNSNVVTEDDQLNPLSLYARSKIDSEKVILSLKDENFSPSILRMATIYGVSPRMRFDLVINTFAMRAATEGKITIFGGDQWRPFIHVEDAAEAYIKCLEAPIDEVSGEIFNIGAHNISISELGELTKQVFPEMKIEKTEKEVIKGALDSRNYKVSFAKMNQKLKYVPHHDIVGAIRDIKQMIESQQIKNTDEKKYYNVEMANSLENNLIKGVD